MSGATQMTLGMGKTPTGARVSIAPSAVNGSPLNGATYSQNVTATPTGITSPTYAWSWLSGGTGFTLANATTATVTINSVARGPNVNQNGELKCVVSGTGGPASSSIPVDVTWGP